MAGLFHLLHCSAQLQLQLLHPPICPSWSLRLLYLGRALTGLPSISVVSRVLPAISLGQCGVSGRCNKEIRGTWCAKMKVVEHAWCCFPLAQKVFRPSIVQNTSARGLSSYESVLTPTNLAIACPTKIGPGVVNSDLPIIIQEFGYQQQHNIEFSNHIHRGSTRPL